LLRLGHRESDPCTRRDRKAVHRDSALPRTSGYAHDPTLGRRQAYQRDTPAWIEVDTRCAAEATLSSLESTLRSLVKETVHGSSKLDSVIAEIGTRPAGSTDWNAALIRTAYAATRHQGRSAIPTPSSSDSNIAMSMGIPAITIGCGGEAEKAHATAE